ncbi:MAG: bifunctional YncE family protein/alkaline phosphatase family protein [Melioribacteraceae bacterium]
MKKKKLFMVVFMSLLFLTCSTHKKNNIKVGPQSDGSFFVPSNQLLRPEGKQIYFPGRPVDLDLSKDGKTLAVLNKSSLEIINIDSQKVIQSLHIGGGASFKGVKFSSDQKNIFASQARDRILIAKLNDENIWQWESSILFKEPAIGGHPIPGGFAISQDESKLLVPLSRSNSIAVVAMNDFSMSEIHVGISPYQVLLISDEKAYVSNWGGRKPKNNESTYESSGSEVLVNSKTGILNSGSISVINLKIQKEENIIEVGLHPTEMVLSPNKELLYATCANSDFVSVIDTKTDKVINEINVKMNKDLPFGSAPNSLKISKDGKNLFVANGTDNAICVIDLESKNVVKGFIPTGWYPGAIIQDNSNKNLIVANTKGIGSRNLGKDAKGYNSHDHLGSISIIQFPSKEKLLKLTEIVKENNSYSKMIENLTKKEKKEETVAVPQLPGQTSFFKHVIYIIKENRTYDQVFGDMPQGDGDSSLVIFGKSVTPNHHALAEEFVLLDNYYCSGVLSADGHQWTDEAYVTDYVEKFFGDFPRSYPYNGGDPIAYSPSGFIWDNVLNNGLTFRNYGEFVDAVIEPSTATFTDIYSDYKNGTKKVKIRSKVNLPQIEKYTSVNFVGFPETIPDVYRAAEFIKDFKEYEKNNNLPNFIIMLLPNDHTSGTRPGLPTPRAAVADNDLALGQIVETISHSKYWKETCILVTEDDPQDGFDHIDGHRTVGLVISPYTKRKEVVSTNYSQINMFRTIENILGIPPLNQFDLAAEPMSDCFTNTPNLTPYKSKKNNIPLDELNPSLSEIIGEQLYWAQKSLEQNLENYDRIDEDTFNRIIWHSVKGWKTPYPKIKL